MSLFPIEIPPGVFRSGTEYRSKGRWYDTNLVRWHEGGALGPVGGWVIFSGSATAGKARAIATWRDDSGNRRAAIGTHSKLYVMNAAGLLFDITPAGFTAGRADAIAATGFGYGPYGGNAYGTARPDTGNYIDATVWDLDFWGQYLVGCSPDDGKLYQWTLNTAIPAAAITNAPTGCSGVVVSPQRFLIALGAGGNKRKVQWSDQEDNTVWSPSSTNQAGDLEITLGKIVCGRAVGDQVLILSDVEAHTLTYQGLPFVYGRSTVGSGCGAISKRCVATIGQQAVWWSSSGFWIYDGAARPLSCDVWDFLLSDLTNSQRSKISSFHNTKNAEVWWLYPSGGSTENDAYVVWDYRKNVWHVGRFARTCGCEPGVFANPFLMGGDGYAYEHENGYSYGGDAPFARSGPIELGDGEKVMEALGLVPDEKTSGDVTASFRTRLYPNAAETVLSSTNFDSTGKVDIRFSARQVELVVTGASASAWRWGSPRLDLRVGGRR